MANLSETQLREEIRRKKLRGVYLLVGGDSFKQDFYTDALTEIIFPDGRRQARELFYGDELNPPALLDNARSLSLWDPHKLILVKQGEKISAKNWEQLSALLREPPERCTICVQSAKADGRLKFFQQLGKAPDFAVQVKLDPAVGTEWARWLQHFLREEGRELSEDARPLLEEWTQGALSELKHLIGRAALFAGNSEELRKEHIRAVGYRAAPEDVFRLGSAILSGDRASALALTHSLVEQGEEPLALIGIMARQYRWMLGILALRAEGKSDAAIASECGIYPAAGKLLFPASRGLGGRGVVRALGRLAEADFQLKSLPRESRDHVLTNLVLAITV